MAEGMGAGAVDVATLPLFTGMRARCPRCRSGPPIRVHFDRGCVAVQGGEHFHRICRCGYSWPEQCTERPNPEATW